MPLAGVENGGFPFEYLNGRKEKVGKGHVVVKNQDFLCEF